jgi:signal transduction histidine kinase
VEVTLLDRDLTVVASSDDSTVDRIEQNPSLQDALRAKTAQARRRSCGADCEAVEVIKPFVLEQQEAGLIRLALNTASLTGVARQAQRGILWYSAGLLVVGVVGAVSIFWLQARHLGERRQLEAAVAQEQRLSAMGNLAAGVAHEIKNPLNAISMGLQRLRMEHAPAAPEARQEFTQFTRIIEAEVARLNTIVNQFLTLARPLRLAVVDESLSSVVKDVLAILEPQAASQGVAFVQDLGRGGFQVPLDRQQFSQALMNILLNGIQAMPNGGTLAVRIEPGVPPPHGRNVDAMARLVITDTGPGIRPENLERIFEPYFTTKEGGTGLGLALARRIVEEHGGSLHADNAPNGGARFMIDLPSAR